MEDRVEKLMLATDEVFAGTDPVKNPPKPGKLNILHTQLLAAQRDLGVLIGKIRSAIMSIPS